MLQLAEVNAPLDVQEVVHHTVVEIVVEIVLGHAKVDVQLRALEDALEEPYL